VGAGEVTTMTNPSNSSTLPGVSVVLCTSNGARFLEEQLRSIESQTRLPVEFVASDDQSSDRTLEILEGFAARVSFPVRILQNPFRLGSTRNFDRAIRQARGEYVALCDQDDLWVNNKLERLLTLLEHDTGLGGVFSDAELVDEKSVLIGRSLFATHSFLAKRQKAFVSDPMQMLLQRDVVTGATLLFRTSIRNHYDSIPSSWVHDGWLAWMIALHSRIGLTTERLTHYRIHPNQQLGVGSPRAARGDNRRFRGLRSEYARLACQWRDLLSHLFTSTPQSQELDRLISGVRRKIAFLDRRSTLSSHRSLRALQLVPMLSSYRRYAPTMGSLRDDLLST
jgi:glycosyltransferase involved in cell wall biosynthesis